MNEQEPERPRVFVTQEGPHDYGPAQRFGDVKFMSAREISSFSTSLRNEETINDLRLAMVDYRPGHDFILPAGSPIAIAHVFMFASRMGDCHRVLKWDNRAHCYNEFQVTI